MRLLVLGRGLLGGALARAEPECVPLGSPIPWTEPQRAAAALTHEVGSFVATAGRAWAIAWCAGTGFVGTGAEHFAIERRYLATVLETIQASATVEQCRRGSFFLASSAGGVHGNGSRQIMTELTTPSPVSEYGISKLLQEEMVTSWSRATGMPALLGRISNLYGPAQNVSKPQGFISHLCRSLLVHRPFVLSVSGETQRDFLYADDAAARILEWLRHPGSTAGARIKVLASSHSVSLQHVINVVRAASGVRPRVVFAANEASRLQPRYLRFGSRELVHLDVLHPARLLEVGVRQTWQPMLQNYAHGRMRV